ncbi:LysR family transcriptional regulator [Marinomonas sp. S3726]|uniref:LysR substrate-binding domain-containing protein n=1 Tax=Marinomonas sp. S3726 TaxID=579484 RepID=UPI000A02D70A
MPRIGMRHLQMVQMITQTGNVSDAAAILGITQSALSHRIREAERLLSAPLFIRRNKKLAPTSAGERLLHSANIILNEVELAEFDIAKYSAGIEQTLRLGVDHRVGSHWLPDLYQNFNDKVPQAEVELVSDPHPDALYCLRNGRLDVCIMSGAKAQAGFKSLFLLRDELVVVFLPDHEFAHKALIEVEDFNDQVYITDTTTPEYHREYEQVFSPNNTFPKQVVRVGRTDNIIAFIKAGKGISILPKWTLQPYLENSNLKYKSIGPEGFYIDWYAFSRKDEKEGSSCQQLADSLICIFS